MNKITLKEPLLYTLLTGAALLLVLLAAGPGITGNGVEGAYQYFQHRVFDLLCHQDQSRSWQFNGHYMAVCSRCFGVYTGFLMFSALMVVTIRPLRIISQHLLMKVLVLTVILNGLDVAGNLFGFWTNTLVTRSILGFASGSVAALFLTDEFFTYNNTETGLSWNMSK